MSDRKCCDQDQNMFPVSGSIHCTQGNQEYDVVISIKIKNVVKAKFEISRQHVWIFSC